MTIIGIDLGTTNSLIAVYQEGSAKILPNAFGENLTPSVVSLDPNGEILVGKAAAERLVTHPELTIANFKRYMGTDKIFKLKQHKFRAEDLASFVLRNLKADAEFLLKEEITEAVISVPAYFNDTQRKATILAGQLAGLKVERLINEPTAAALAYGLHDKDDEKTFLVFDLGGGTFDVSILEMYEGIMEVRASGGDNYLGGQDFLEVLVKDFLDNSKLDKKRLTSNELSRLYFLGERCKKNLSIQDAATLEIEIQGKAFQWEIHRARFEKISDNLIQRMCIPVERALRDASIKPAALDSVVLVGGATKMPLMRSLVSKMFGRLPASHINPEEVVAIGTAIQAGLKARDQALNEVILTDVCPYSLGVNSASQVGEGYVSGVFLPILERNTVVPASKVKRVSTISPRQKGLRIEVFQGESRIVKNNIKLGQFSVDLIPMDDIQEIDIRFTYDINGILEVESTVLATGAKRIEVFENHAIAISKEDIAKRFKELSEIKIHPRDQAENRMLMAKAERMYEELLGPGREYLQVELGRFEQILENQDIREIEAARNNLHELLERIEENY